MIAWYQKSNYALLLVFHSQRMKGYQLALILYLPISLYPALGLKMIYPAVAF